MPGVDVAAVAATNADGDADWHVAADVVAG